MHSPNVSPGKARQACVSEWGESGERVGVGMLPAVCAALLWARCAGRGLVAGVFPCLWDPHSRPASTFLLALLSSLYFKHFFFFGLVLSRKLSSLAVPQQMKSTQLMRLWGILLTVVNWIHPTLLDVCLSLEAVKLLIQKQNRSRSFKCSRLDAKAPINKAMMSRARRCVGYCHWCG